MDIEKLELCPRCVIKAERFDRKSGATYEYHCECCGSFDIHYDDILRLNQESQEHRGQYHEASCKNASRKNSE